MSFRSRVNRLMHKFPHTEPIATCNTTPDQRVAIIRAVFRRLVLSDPFPALEGTCYLEAFFPWFYAGGPYVPQVAQPMEQEPLFSDSVHELA